MVKVHEKKIQSIIMRLKGDKNLADKNNVKQGPVLASMLSNIFAQRRTRKENRISWRQLSFVFFKTPSSFFFLLVILHKTAHQQIYNRHF